MNPETKLAHLKRLLTEYSDLVDTIGLLDWDMETYMPPGGSSGRGFQKATISRIAHLKLTSGEMGKLLEELISYEEELDPDSDDARLIRKANRLYKKKSKVPADLAADIAKATSDAYYVWVRARENSNFSEFQPALERILDLKRQLANCFQPFDHIYDPLLDDYEPGLKTADVQQIFASLRPEQVNLLQAITQRPQVDDSFLHQDFEEKAQWQFGVKVITDFGYDWNRGRQDLTAHPFTQDIGLGDVRITTRVMNDYLPSAFFSTTHESGHAIYSQGMDRNLDRTPLAQGASYAINESQSRMYENIIGRSRHFWLHYYPELQSLFPAQLSQVPLDMFYKAINKVKPSFIRVEADEATYNMHIMMRLELEIALLEGSLEVRDLPEAWNSSMHEYLGLTPPNDAMGVLQDVHWSQGYFGYFSTYALGNLIAAQLWERMEEDLPDVFEQIGRGQFSDLTAWMREKVHRHGAKYEPQELVQRITGSKIDQRPYMRYLTNKYTEIYQL
ncbi:MAG: carboxypeptidase M32 [Chloroflexota bacterium]|nr:MAG: carboxypeptidase M32 [Chloroflexota bacterium]